MNQYVSLFTPKIRLGKISQSKLSTFEKRLLKTVYFSHLYRYLFYEDFHGINLREKSVSVSGIPKDDTLSPSTCKFIYEDSLK